MKWGVKVILGMLLVSVCFSTVVLGRNLWLQEKEQHIFAVLRARVSKVSEEHMEQLLKDHEVDFTNERGAQKEVLPEYRELVKENPDFAGWISIEETRIDYPVMQKKEEPEYYLHRNFYGEDSYAGVPFVGWGDLKDGGGAIFLYGHNMRNGTMFADLLKYRKEGYLKDHPIIRLDSIYERHEYRVVAILDVTEDEWLREDGMFYGYMGSKDVRQDGILEDVKENALCAVDFRENGGEKLLFLVTCGYLKEEGRVVLVAEYSGKDQNDKFCGRSL